MTDSYNSPELQPDAELPPLDTLLQDMMQEIDNHDAREVRRLFEEIKRLVVQDYMNEAGAANPNEVELEKLRQLVDQMDAMSLHHEELLTAGEDQQVLDETAELFSEQLKKLKGE